MVLRPEIQNKTGFFFQQNTMKLRIAVTLLYFYCRLPKSITDFNFTESGKTLSYTAHLILSHNFLVKVTCSKLASFCSPRHNIHVYFEGTAAYQLRNASSRAITEVKQC